MKLSPLQEFVFYRTYSRWNEELQRRETWDEAVERYFSFFKSKFVDKIPKKVWVKAQENVSKMRTMPSMRAFWTAGPALEATHVAGYNCSYLAFKDLFSPCELFYILMCGTGAGFSVEKEFTNRMPAVVQQTGAGKGVHIVEDNKEGWADSLKVGLEAWFGGQDVEFDYSRIRPRGARLKTMGGRASGPEPLKELHVFVRDIVLKAQGRQLKTIEWLDVGNKIAEVVVVGGVRRSSEITFSDLDDNDIRDAKDFSKGAFPVHRYMSNNSAVYNGTPDMVTFMREWTALAASGSGERGIFNTETSLLGAPRRKDVGHFRTNPCFAPGTLIQTKTGHFPIEDLVGKEVEVWDGLSWVKCDNFRITGTDQPILRVEFQDGSFERVTPYHSIVLEDGSRVEAQNVVTGMKIKYSEAPLTHGTIKIQGAYLKGFLIADGTTDGEKPMFLLYSSKYCCEQRLLTSAAEIGAGVKKTNAVSELGFSEEHEVKRKAMRGLSVRKNELMPWVKEFKKTFPTEVFQWDLPSKLEFVAGVMDGDGTVMDSKNGFGYQISSIHKDWLLGFQLLLKTIGVRSKVALTAPSGERDFGHRGGVVHTKDLWRLTVSQEASIVLAKQVNFERLKSLAEKQTTYKLKSRANKIVSVRPDGSEQKVFCCTIPSTHALSLSSGFYWGQCGEILLRDGEFCNLSEVVVRKNDTFADLVEKVKTTVWLGVMQSCLTDFPYLRPDFKLNCEEERLLGVSLTGQMDNPKLMTENRLADLKEVAISECRKACKALGVNMSVAITTGKPSGTVSQLVDSASGAHPRFAKYYIRRVRISADDPLCRMMRDFGVPMSPENGQGPKDYNVEKKRTDLNDARKKFGMPLASEEELKILVPEWDESKVNTWVLSFPEKAPDGAITKDDMTAIEQLEWYKKIRTNWCEHNQSITVYVRENEWLEVGSWVYKNFDIISGVSFLPFDGGRYDQAPYEEITEKQYEALKKRFPEIDYTKLSEYEKEDNTTGAQALACSAGGCEIP